MGRWLVRAFDGFLRRRLGVREFERDADAILRIRLTLARHALALPGTLVPAGAPVIELHIWNEQVPPMPPRGPDLAWAQGTTRRILQSLRHLAGTIVEDPQLRQALALGGATVLAPPFGASRSFTLAARLGFATLPYDHRLGRFAEFWENFYTWVLMWTFNQASLRQRRLFGMRRTEIWMSMEEFLRRYGSSRGGRHPAGKMRTERQLP
jgi:hypothetical protein